MEIIRAARADAIAIYLFGSRAAGADTAGSDVDLAVLCGASMTPAERWDLQESVASAVRIAVDLVDLRGASAVMRVQVLRDGVLLYDSEPRRRQEFEAVALASYARLNEERAGILADVRRRGSVHG